MSEQKLHSAIIAVTQDVKSIDKEMTIGSGNNSYKGVADKDVKQHIGQSMARNGLTCLCINLVPTIRVDRWTEEDPWYKATPKAMGYGHGVDPQDKSVGKATTYALKNALLYTFLVPTGAIEDTDNTHSDDQPPAIKLPPLINDKKFNNY